MPNIVLSSAVRANVLQLQDLTRNQGIVQNRLATGLRVASALDDPRNFFQSQGLNNRASDLTRLLDSMGIAVRTFEAADKGITAMTKIAEAMIGIARQAREENDQDNRDRLEAQFNELKAQMQALAEDSDYNGVNLLGGGELKIVFNTDTDPATQSNLTINGDETDDDFIDLVGDLDGNDVIADATFSDGGEIDIDAIDETIQEVQAFIRQMRTTAAVLGTNLTTVRIREDFTKQMVNTLKAGADGLTLADQNEEAANLLALNTRQQLSQQALALATQSEQSILRLLG